MTLRPPDLRRVFLFLAGAERQLLLDGAETGADVLIQELEDFTPAARRPEARSHCAPVFEAWRKAGKVVAARINPLEICGHDDLASVVPAKPDIIMMSMVATPGQVAALDAAVTQLERQHGLAPGKIELVPNIETAKGLINTAAIAAASPRVSACLLASEDLAADLGAERGPDGIEFAYARSRFLVECRAAGIEAIDRPYTFSNIEGAAREARDARRLGYRCKASVSLAHVAALVDVFTPAREDVTRARAMVHAFDTARAAGKDRVEFEGALVEKPTVNTARRIIARAEGLASFNQKQAR